MSLQSYFLKSVFTQLYLRASQLLPASPSAYYAAFIVLNSQLATRIFFIRTNLRSLVLPKAQLTYTYLRILRKALYCLFTQTISLQQQRIIPTLPSSLITSVNNLILRTQERFLRSLEYVLREIVRRESSLLTRRNTQRRFFHGLDSPQNRY